jgi:hypothetical protein
LRAARQGHGDHDALAHAAAHLERISLDAAFGFGNADLAEPLDGLLARLITVEPQVAHDRFDHLLGDAHDRVERGHRILKHRADKTAADGVELALAEFGNIAAIEQHLAAGDLAGMG